METLISEALTAFIMSEDNSDTSATQMTKAVVKIVNSASFNKDDFLREKLSLSQAFCLLWHNPESGDVSGRKCSVECNAAVVAAALIDLAALDRIDVEVKKNKTLGFRNDLNLLKIKKDQLTGTYLDDTLFESQLNAYRKSPDKPEKIKDIILWKIRKWTATDLVSTHTLDSLVDLGILDMKEKWNGRMYPIVKPALQEYLRDQIRSVVLDSQEPNSFIEALLILSRLADALSTGTLVLKKWFTKEEYSKAKKTMNNMVGIGWFGQLKEDKGTGDKYQVLDNFE